MFIGKMAKVKDLKGKDKFIYISNYDNKFTRIVRFCIG